MLAFVCCDYWISYSLFIIFIAVKWVQRVSSNIIWSYGKVSPRGQVLEFTTFYHNAVHLTRMYYATKKPKAQELQGAASVLPCNMNFSTRKVTVSFCFRPLHHAWLSHSSLLFHCVKVLWIWTVKSCIIYFFVADSSDLWIMSLLFCAISPP